MRRNWKKAPRASGAGLAASAKFHLGYRSYQEKGQFPPPTQQFSARLMVGKFLGGAHFAFHTWIVIAGREKGERGRGREREREKEYTHRDYCTL